MCEQCNGFPVSVATGAKCNATSHPEHTLPDTILLPQEDTAYVAVFQVVAIVHMEKDIQVIRHAPL